MINSKSKIEAAISELSEVCDKHGIFLIGTSRFQDFYGEITIGLRNNPESTSWSNPESRADSLCFDGDVYINRIGRINNDN